MVREATCSICLEGFRYPKGILPCQHEFCYECLMEWAEHKNQCPLGRETFTEIRKVHDNGHDEVIQAPTPASEEDMQWQWAEDAAMDYDDYLASIECVGCQSGDDEDILMLCDACNMAYHTYCLDDPLDAVPDGDWYCDSCSNIIDHGHQSSPPVDAPMPLEENGANISVK